jgi:hypothetical protein
MLGFSRLVRLPVVRPAFLLAPFWTEDVRTQNVQRVLNWFFAAAWRRSLFLLLFYFRFVATSNIVVFFHAFILKAGPQKARPATSPAKCFRSPKCRSQVQARRVVLGQCVNLSITRVCERCLR